MRRAAYIAVLGYIPLMILAILSPDTMVWNKLYFLLDNALLCTLLFALGRSELVKIKRYIFYLASIPQIALIIYIIVDWQEKERTNLLIACIMALTLLVITPLTLILHDRKI